MKKMLIKLPVSLPVTYPILVEAGLLQYPSVWLPYNLNFKKIVIITDNNIKKLYGDDLAKLLIKHGCNVLLLSFAPGEKSKNSLIKQKLEKKMFINQFDKNTLCLALGGGVVGDLTGFIAATYMRGIPYIQIPTSLLAMVDSSIGGKTGINTSDGKNLIGSFWQPKAVVVDLNCLKTLPQRHLVNGLIEIIKVFLIDDEKYFLYFQKNINKIKMGDEVVLNNLILRAIKIKARLVSQDEKENNQRKMLNFGHTIGHALEKISAYKMLHGEAVAFGILVESRISNLLGILNDEDYAGVVDMMFLLGFSFEKLRKINVNKVIQATQLDKKIKQGEVQYVLLKKIGQVHESKGAFVHPVVDDIVKQALYDR